MTCREPFMSPRLNRPLCELLPALDIVLASNDSRAEAVNVLGNDSEGVNYVDYDGRGARVDFATFAAVASAGERLSILGPEPIDEGRDTIIYGLKYSEIKGNEAIPIMEPDEQPAPGLTRTRIARDVCADWRGDLKPEIYKQSCQWL